MATSRSACSAEHTCDADSARPVSRDSIRAAHHCYAAMVSPRDARYAVEAFSTLVRVADQATGSRSSGKTNTERCK
jgi:hypothetical protein